MQYIKKVLVGVLAITTLIEFCLGIVALLAPEKMMDAFGITTVSADVFYLACIISWFCLVVAFVAGLATFWVHQDRFEGYCLSLVLGVFWLGIGLHLGIAFARPQHLILDAAKGMLILVLTFFSCRLKCTSSKQKSDV